MSPVDPCRWCGHERREHGRRPGFAGSYVIGCEGGEKLCPCTRFRRTWSWMRPWTAGKPIVSGPRAAYPGGPDPDE